MEKTDNNSDHKSEITAREPMELPRGSDLAADMRKEQERAHEMTGSGSARQVPDNSRQPAEYGSRRNDIEKDLRKKFKRDLIGRFEKAVVQYQLVEEGDRIAVCISGGKDSMLMAKLFQELKRHNKFPFSLFFLSMDPGYLPENRRLIEENAELLGIPIEFCSTQIFDAVSTIEKSPCYLCARMRRGYLYRFAKERGCNKIALGHHYDDAIETILMGMLYSGQYQAMLPKLRSTNFEGMELIRPMYLIREKDILRWRDYNGLRFLQCACRFTEALEKERYGAFDEPSASKRLETKKLIAELSKTIPQVEANIFRATENVVLNKVLGYKIRGEKHSFLEDY
ncbi:MAG: ATP-binding protein [Eubacteriales bacterium]|nr:ATP-binding protein [Eubacteriales bacterium]